MNTNKIEISVDEMKRQTSEETQVKQFMLSMGYDWEERNGEIYFFSEDADYDYESAKEYYEMNNRR